MKSKSFISVFIRFAAIAAASLSMSFAAHAQSGNGYNNAQLRGNVENATVLQTRTVQVQNPNYQERAVGTAVGGVLGALIGNSAAGKSRSSTSRILAAGLGAAAGGYAGNKVVDHLAQKDAQEVVLQLPSGRTYSVVQPMPAEHLNPGDSVRVLQQAGQTRVIRMAGSSGYGQQHQPQYEQYQGGSAPQYREIAPTQFEQSYDRPRQQQAQFSPYSEY